MAQFQERYDTEVVPALMERFGYTNRLAVPKLEKIMLSAGVGRAAEEKERLQQTLDDLATLSGQKAVPRKARRSVAGLQRGRFPDPGGGVRPGPAAASGLAQDEKKRNLVRWR